MAEDSYEDQELPKLAEQIGTFATGLPPQLQKNFWKAIGRVFQGLAELPAAHLEGRAAKARARLDAEAADIRAEQRARELVLIGSAEAAAHQFGVTPDLARRAVDYHAADIVREQVNREAVLRVAAEELAASAASSEDAATEIDDDWLVAFFKEACAKSNEDVRSLFGRILAGEIRSPGSFSMRTLQSLVLLDQNTATNF